MSYRSDAQPSRRERPDREEKREKKEMLSSRKCRRRHHRLSVNGDESFRVEFQHPGPHGAEYSLKLRDVSQAGVSFELDRELPGIEIGYQISNVTVFLGTRKLKGDLVIVHVSSNGNSAAICGALFYPMTDDDLVKLKSTVKELLAS